VASRIHCSTARPVSATSSAEPSITVIRHRSRDTPPRHDHRIADQPSVVSTCGLYGGVLPPVPAQPVREHDMAAEQVLGLAAAAQPVRLDVLDDVEQADRDVHRGGGGGGQHIGRRDRISREQQMPAATRIHPHRPGS
jgi:hypothetical protein